MFGSPELWVGETSIVRNGDGTTEWAEYRAVVENRGSDEATGCAAAFELTGDYDDLDEGHYRFTIKQPGRWARDGEATAVTIPADDALEVEVFRVLADDDAEYDRVAFPTDATLEEPSVDRYLQVDDTVKRFDQREYVPVPVFARTDWDPVSLSVSADNHGDVDRDLTVSAPDPPMAVDDVAFEVEFDDDESVPSFTPF